MLFLGNIDSSGDQAVDDFEAISRALARTEEELVLIIFELSSVWSVRLGFISLNGFKL